MTSGLLVGGIGDLVRLSKAKRFLDKAKQALPENKTAIVMNIVESWETPLNTIMKPYDAKIIRVNVNEELAKFAEDEKEHVQDEIQDITSKIEASNEENKLILDNKINELKRSSELLENKNNSNSEKKSFTNWLNDVKFYLNDVKLSINDYFDDEKEEMLEDYKDLKEEYFELSLKVKRN